MCDLSKSSTFLNDNDSASALETFLPRLYWASAMAVEAAGGRFIKWTGDGFLAWFETPIHRLMSNTTDQIFHAAYFLTVLVNVTQLGVKSEQKLRIRHGVCFEHDALLINISHSDHQSLDLIGRAVVLAFRLSGLSAGFPNIVTQQDLIAAASPPRGYSWKKRSLTRDERLKYFKGEEWGTKALFVSSGETKKPRSIASTLKTMKGAIATFDGPEASSEDSFGAKLVPKMLKGPEWCRVVMKEYGDHTKQLYDAVLNALPVIESLAKEPKQKGQSKTRQHRGKPAQRSR